MRDHRAEFCQKAGEFLGFYEDSQKDPGNTSLLEKTRSVAKELQGILERYRISPIGAFSSGGGGFHCIKASAAPGAGEPIGFLIIRGERAEEQAADLVQNFEHVAKLGREYHSGKVHGASDALAAILESRIKGPPLIRDKYPAIDVRVENNIHFVFLRQVEGVTVHELFAHMTKRSCEAGYDRILMRQAARAILYAIAQATACWEAIPPHNLMSKNATCNWKAIYQYYVCRPISCDGFLRELGAKLGYTTEVTDNQFFSSCKQLMKGITVDIDESSGNAGPYLDNSLRNWLITIGGVGVESCLKNITDLVNTKSIEGAVKDIGTKHLVRVDLDTFRHPYCIYDEDVVHLTGAESLRHLFDQERLTALDTAIWCQLTLIRQAISKFLVQQRNSGGDLTIANELAEKVVGLRSEKITPKDVSEFSEYSRRFSKTHFKITFYRKLRYAERAILYYEIAEGHYAQNDCDVLQKEIVHYLDAALHCLQPIEPDDSVGADVLKTLHDGVAHWRDEAKKLRSGGIAGYTAGAPSLV